MGARDCALLTQPARQLRRLRSRPPLQPPPCVGWGSSRTSGGSMWPSRVPGGGWWCWGTATRYARTATGAPGRSGGCWPAGSLPLGTGRGGGRRGGGGHRPAGRPRAGRLRGSSSCRACCQACLGWELTAISLSYISFSLRFTSAAQSFSCKHHRNMRPPKAFSISCPICCQQDAEH